MLQDSTIELLSGRGTTFTCFDGSSKPSAENLITLGCEHHDGTTCHMSLWQKVSVSGKTELP